MCRYPVVRVQHNLRWHILYRVGDVQRLEIAAESTAQVILQVRHHFMYVWIIFLLDMDSGISGPYQVDLQNVLFKVAACPDVYLLAGAFLSVKNPQNHLLSPKQQLTLRSNLMIS